MQSADKHLENEADSVTQHISEVAQSTRVNHRGNHDVGAEEIWDCVTNSHLNLQINIEVGDLLDATLDQIRNNLWDAGFSHLMDLAVIADPADMYSNANELAVSGFEMEAEVIRTAASELQQTISN